MMVDVAVIVMNRDRPDITDAVVDQLRRMGNQDHIRKEIFVIEAGSRRPGGCSQSMTHWFRDRNYRGRYYAFHRGLQFARKVKSYNYYWFVVNDIVFTQGQDCLAELIQCMEQDPRMGLIGPCELDAKDYRGAEPNPAKGRWHKAATVHGLAHLIRGEVIESIGYMNTAFRYSQGAGSEYSYKLYKSGWFMAYADRVTVRHDQSGSTYGKVVSISRHEYQRRANKFASHYLAKRYGHNWDVLFASVLPDDVEEKTFAWQKEVWARNYKRNWKECCPWFWRTGALVKSAIRSVCQTCFGNVSGDSPR